MPSQKPVPPAPPVLPPKTKTASRNETKKSAVRGGPGNSAAERIQVLPSAEDHTSLTMRSVLSIAPRFPHEGQRSLSRRDDRTIRSSISEDKYSSQFI